MTICSNREEEGSSTVGHNQKLCSSRCCCPAFQKKDQTFQLSHWSQVERKQTAAADQSALFEI